MWRKKGSISAIITFAQIFILAIVISLSHTGAKVKAVGSIDITGAVTNSSGIGVADVSVYATDPGTDNVDFGPITTGSDGSYDLQVSAGTYDFHFDPSFDSGLSATIDSNVTVLNDQTIDIQLATVPPPSHTLSGTLLDGSGNPISGVTIGISDTTTGNYSGSSTTDTNGNFSITVPAGVYKENMYVPGDNITVPKEYFFDGGTFDLSNSDVSQNIQLPATVTVTVVAEDANGNPLSGVLVGVQAGSSNSEAIFPGSSSVATLVGGYENSGGTTDSTGTYTSQIQYQGLTIGVGGICATLPNSGRVCNTSDVSTNGDVTIIFKPESQTPTITSSPTTTTSTGPFPYSFTVTTTGTPSPTLTESGTLPPGLSFTDNGNGTATITGTPAVTDTGSYPVTITATNSAGSVNQTLTITVPPAFTSSNSDTEVFGTSVNFPITTTGFSSYATIKKLEGTGAFPPGISLTYNGNGTASLSGTPSNSANGAYTFTLSATNNVGSPVTQVFTMTITKSPVFKLVRTSQEASIVGTPYSLTITASGYGTPTLTQSGSLPSGLSFHDNGNGTATISGTPAVGSGGAYPFTVTATNSYGTTTDNLTIKNSEAPTITSSNNATATPGSAFYFAVTSTGYPAANYSLTGTLPNGIHFYPGPGTFGGTPNSNDIPGTYNVTITAANSVGSKSQSFSLTVL